MSALAAKLAQARADARTLDPRETAGQVGSVADAYRVQDALAAKAGAVRAWKVSALIPEQQCGYPTDRPVAGPLFAPFFHASPASVTLARFVAPLLECEIAFRLGRAFRFADAAVDAFVGMDDEHVLALVEAVHRTHLHAIHVFALDAILDDDVGHVLPSRGARTRKCIISSSWLLSMWMPKWIL